MVKEIIPFMRVAGLLDIKDRPSQRQAEVLIREMAHSWPNLERDYKEVIAVALNESAIEASIGDFRFADNERLRERWEADTRVLDGPLLHYKNGQKSFEIRVCIAVCTGLMSTKIWVRIGKPIIGKRRLGVSVEEIRGVIASYEIITRKVAEWMSGNLKSMIEDKYPRFNVTNSGRLDISAFGIRDADLAKYFQKFLETSISMDEILQEPEANEKLSYYYSKVSEIKDLLNLTMAKKGENLEWYTSPVMVAVDSGYFEPREVLYLDRKLNNERQLIGISYDDSIDGELSPRSSLKIATYLGKNVV